jgi:hypothetical protein
MAGFGGTPTRWRAIENPYPARGLARFIPASKVLVEERPR